MLALDTNVLVRFLVEDDTGQTRQARDLIAGAIARGSPLYISEIVLCEVVWVLSRAYRFPRGEIGGVLRRLAGARHLLFPSRRRVLNALDRFESGKGDFSDYLIAEQARDAGCEAVATFDRTVAGEPGFIAPA